MTRLIRSIMSHRETQREQAPRPRYGCLARLRFKWHSAGEFGAVAVPEMSSVTAIELRVGSGF